MSDFGGKVDNRSKFNIGIVVVIGIVLWLLVIGALLFGQ